MTRISENQLRNSLLLEIQKNRERYSTFSDQIASGYKVKNPGDSTNSGVIEQYQQLLGRIDGHSKRVSGIQGFLAFQDNALQQANDLVVRAKELAAQGANETLGPTVRAQMAEEVWQIRDHLVSLANSKYQGNFVFAGLDDDDAPFGANSYTDTPPTTGSMSQRWVYDDTSSVTGEPGNGLSRSVNITDDLTIVVNTPGDQIFSNALEALEVLGRALAGYSTNTTAGTGTAYTLPGQMNLQTSAIQNALGLLETARSNDILPERVSIGARQTRLDTAQSLIELAKTDAQEVLNDLQNADLAEASTGLQQAELALQASFTVTNRVINLSILDYL